MKPTTAFDVVLQTQILALLKTTTATKNMAMILISHDLNLVKQYTQIMWSLNQGQVEEQVAADWKFYTSQNCIYTKFTNHDFDKLYR